MAPAASISTGTGTIRSDKQKKTADLNGSQSLTRLHEEAEKLAKMSSFGLLT
jgi:hypothetical protein